MTLHHRRRHAPKCVSSPAARRRATLRGVVLTFRVCQRTVAVALAWRLHLRPLIMDPGVFPPAASQAHYKPGSFLSWSFSLPQGSTSHHRLVHLPADSSWLDSEHPSEVRLPLQRSQHGESTSRNQIQRAHIPTDDGELGERAATRRWRSVPPSLTSSFRVPCPTADGSVVVIGTSWPDTVVERSNDALERAHRR